MDLISVKSSLKSHHLGVVNPFKIFPFSKQVQRFGSKRKMNKEVNFCIVLLCIVTTFICCHAPRYYYYYHYYYYYFCGVGWRVCDTSSRQITEVKHTCPQPVTGLVSRLVFTGSIPALHTNLWFQKHLKPTSG